MPRITTDPSILAEIPQMDFLDGIKAWFKNRCNKNLTNTKLAEIAMVDITTVEGWRTKESSAFHRTLSCSRKVLISFRLQELFKKDSLVKQRELWSALEDDALKMHYGEMSIDEIQSIYLPNRTRSAIKARCSILGISKKYKKHPWNLYDPIVIEYYRDTSASYCVQKIKSRFPGSEISPGSIAQRAYQLGIKKHSRRDYQSGHSDNCR